MALALRIVLSLLLVLNGIGTAAAAARMASNPGAHHAVAKDAAERGASHGEASPAAHHDGHAAAQRCGDHARPDCCGSSACDCPCAHGVSTAVSAFPFATFRFQRAAIASAPSSTHAAPALPIPIRPPIA